ncbi:MAG: hypothetical protein Q4B22_10505 [Eubacteriales bacterium]|nr:hypothetical protein [Eubacteriales bacterium]
MKKKTGFKRLTALLLVCLLAVSLSACATKLSGTYKCTDGLIEQSLTFKKDNIVEMSAFGINAEGEYHIEDGEIKIKYSLLNLSYEWSESFEKDGKTITIGGTKFVKE